MPEWITWVFDGIGSTIFSLIAGALIGGAVGYKIGVHKNVKQKQTGGDNVKQRQEFTLENENLTGTWRGEFRAVEDGTRVTFTERIQPRKWWMRLFARRYLQSQQRRYFEDLQRTLVNRAP